MTEDFQTYSKAQADAKFHPKMAYDDAPTEGSGNALTSGAVYDAIQSATAGEGNVDTTPTAGSTNLVTSGGVKDYVDGMVAGDESIMIDFSDGIILNVSDSSSTYTNVLAANQETVAPIFVVRDRCKTIYASVSTAGAQSTSSTVSTRSAPTVSRGALSKVVEYLIDKVPKGYSLVFCLCANPSALTYYSYSWKGELANK